MITNSWSGILEGARLFTPFVPEGDRIQAMRRGGLVSQRVSEK